MVTGMPETQLKPTLGLANDILGEEWDGGFRD